MTNIESLKIFSTRYIFLILNFNLILKLIVVVTARCRFWRGYRYSHFDVLLDILLVVRAVRGTVYIHIVYVRLLSQAVSHSMIVRLERVARPGIVQMIVFWN